MSDKPVFLISGNEEIKYRNMFIENLVFHEKHKRENPLVIDQFASGYTPGTIKKNNKNRIGKPFLLNSNLEFVSVPFYELYKEIKNTKSKMDVFSVEKGFTGYYWNGDIKLDHYKLYDLIDCIILLIRNSAASSSYLYSYLKKMLEQKIDKKIYVIVSGEKNIDDAADFFIKLRAEMLNMTCEHFDMNFAGNIFWDEYKENHSRGRKEVYIESFFEDSFHGEIKYVDELLSKVKIIGKKRSFFKELSKYDFDDDQS
jgi:hypothetical protein